MSNIDKRALREAVADLKAGYTLGHADVAILNELARIALASLEAEPVAWTDEQELRDVEKFGCAYLFTVNPITPNADQRRVIKLYSAPPAPVSVPDELTREEYKRRFMEDDDFDDTFRGGFNACRAAMLQGADGNFPDGWVACSERMPVENDIVLVVDDGYFVCEAQYREGDFYSAVRGGGEFFETTCRDVELWQPMPAAPQQEAKNV